MAKKVIANVKLQIPAAAANPAPPVGPALGQHGVNIMEFCKAFNARTQEQKGYVIPVVITIFSDRSFTFVTKTPPASHVPYCKDTPTLVPIGSCLLGKFLFLRKLIEFLVEIPFFLAYHFCYANVFIYF